MPRKSLKWIYGLIKILGFVALLAITLGVYTPAPVVYELQALVPDENQLELDISANDFKFEKTNEISMQAKGEQL